MQSWKRAGSSVPGVAPTAKNPDDCREDGKLSSHFVEALSRHLIQNRLMFPSFKQ